MELNDLIARNARVEADKAWETSWTRKTLITLLTYAIIAAYLAALGVEKFFLHAAIPAGGYFLSTLTMPVFKKFWIEKVYNKNEVSK